MKTDEILARETRVCTHTYRECDLPDTESCDHPEKEWYMTPKCCPCPHAGVPMPAWVHSYRCRHYHEDHPSWTPPHSIIEAREDCHLMAWLPRGYNGDYLPQGHEPLRYGGFLCGKTITIIHGSKGFG